MSSVTEEMIYPKKNPLPFILYPPPMWPNAVGNDFVHKHLDIKSTVDDEFLVYISIPFCNVRCHSCPYFVDFVPREVEGLQTYVDALCEDIKRWGSYPRFKSGTLKSVFIGGGTGSILPVPMLKQVLDSLSESFNCSDDISISLEGNPRDFYDEKIDFIITDKRINRISLGVQSFNPKVLKIVGSPHAAEASTQVINKFVAKGFDNINIDMMYNMPGHTQEVWREDLGVLKSLGIKHFTIYLYRIHEGTAQEKFIDMGKVPQVLDKNSSYVIDMHAQAVKIAEEEGFKMYMFDHFAVPGHESPYNIWTFGEAKDTLGIGAGAFSFINNFRLGTDKNVKGYIESVKKGEHRISLVSEKLDLRNKMERYIIMAFQFFRINFKKFYDMFKVDFQLEFRDVIDRLLSKKLIIETPEYIEMTALGREWAMNVLLEFVNDKYWGGKAAQDVPNWAMNINMVNMVSVEREDWLGSK